MENWKRVAAVTLVGTVCCVAFSLFFNYLLLLAGSLTPFGRLLIGASVVPLAIALPGFLLLALKQQEIRRIRHQLTRTATYDPATSVFNGITFSSLVDRRARAEQTERPRKGAFLVINAEDIRLVNTRYGLGWGEEALRLIASVIRSSVRSGDMVGRLGQSEFGVFLPGASEENARRVGERIRAGVAKTYFQAAGERGALDVSVGGVVFEGGIGFQQMFRAAEQQLSTARHSGAVELAHEVHEASKGGAPSTH